MDFARQVKDSVDIANVIGDFVRLKKQGSSRFVGLCPFHTEKSPSFSVHSGLQIYKCFGCGQSGDVFNFLMELQGLTFIEALKTLADQQGIPMPRRNAGSDAESKLRDSLMDLQEIGQEFFVAQLRANAGRQAREYLQSRGLSDETVEQFGVGYAPAGNALLGLMRKRGFDAAAILAAGLIGKSEDRDEHYDRFRDRLMFPIHNEVGRVIAFGGRSLQADRQPKYLNSPETNVYKKTTVLYNLSRAKASMRKQEFVVLVEGYMDVIGVWRAGVTNAVATCGTALTQQQVRSMRRHVNTVVVNFDSDRAGQDAVARSIELLLREGLNVQVLELPDGQDPDDFCSAHGADAYKAQLERAPRYFIWLADRARKQFDTSSSEGRVAAFEHMLPAINLLPDEIRRAAVATELADQLGIARSLVLERFRRSTNQRQRTPAPVDDTDGLSAAERLLLHLFASSADARNELLADAYGIASEDGLPSRESFAAMVAVHDIDDEFQYPAVEGRLGERDRARLSKLIFDRHREAATIDEGRGALDALRRQSWERRYRAVRKAISESEQSGDRAATIALLTDKVDLERKLGMLGATNR
jgi:DNA primase